MFGFPAKYVGVKHFQADAARLRNAVLDALDWLEWLSFHRATDSIRAHVPWNAWSWGERVRIEINDDGEMRVASRCAFPLQWFDWGKNRRNVNAVLTAVADALASEAADGT